MLSKKEMLSQIEIRKCRKKESQSVNYNNNEERGTK